VNVEKLTGRSCECGVIEWLSENVELFYVGIVRYDKHAAESYRRQFYSKLDEYCETFDWWMTLPHEQKITYGYMSILSDSKWKCAEIASDMEIILQKLRKRSEKYIGYN
jgi:hypothetical protein